MSISNWLSRFVYSGPSFNYLWCSAHKTIHDCRFVVSKSGWLCDNVDRESGGAHGSGGCKQKNANSGNRVLTPFLMMSLILRRRLTGIAAVLTIAFCVFLHSSKERRNQLRNGALGSLSLRFLSHSPRQRTSHGAPN